VKRRNLGTTNLTVTPLELGLATFQLRMFCCEFACQGWEDSYAAVSAWLVAAERWVDLNGTPG
jgi:aryl-alcohol dehydrogenase-like predicted oxidoreductase